MPHRIPSQDPFSHHKHRRLESSDAEEPRTSRSSQPAESSSWSLMEKVRSMFSWIAHRITEEAKGEELSHSGEASAKRVLSQYSSRDLLRRAEASIARVELSKQVLLQEFGPRAQAFVDRYVDSIVNPIKTFVLKGREGQLSESLKGAVGNVELLAMLHDDSRLMRKIRDTLGLKTRDVILEDIAFLLSYPSEAIEEASIPSLQRAVVLRKIEEALQPVLLELESLLSVRPPRDECISLFQWRLGVDAKRQSLHDRALQLIDEEIQRSVPLWGIMRNIPSRELTPFLEELQEFSQGNMTWPLSLLELEEISSYILKSLEGNVEDERLLSLFYQIKDHVETLIESQEGEEHEAVLSRIIDHIRTVEELLGLKGAD